MASETKQQCSKRMMSGYHVSICRATASVERDGVWYCKRHDPKRVQARIEAQKAKWDAEVAETRRLRREAAKKQAHADMCAQFHERLVESLSELSAVIAHFQAGNAHLSQADERVSRAEALISEIDFLSEISKAAE